MKRLSTAVLMSLFIVSMNTSGCLSDSIKEVLNIENHGVPGSLTMACLRADQHKSLEFEIVFESGYRPETSSITMLEDRIMEVCDKPSGITFNYIESTFSIDSWSADDVREQGWKLKEEHPHSTSTLYWQLIFPSGSYVDDSVLGVAVDGSTIAIFKDSIEEAEGFFGRPSAEDVENSVVVHEVGHLLGLVNLVYQSPRPHEDSSHPGHSNNEDSVMYWAIESTSLMNFITGDLPNEFDSDDLADLSDMKNEKIKPTDQLWQP